MINREKQRNVNQVISRLACTGCGACAFVCPINCLLMVLDDEGFLAPIVDIEKCINCGVCVEHCPQLDSDENSNHCRIYCCN